MRAERITHMGNLTVRTHPLGATVGLALLMVFSSLGGAWVAGLYDVLRIGVLDNALANELGYIGEINDSTRDPRPWGISRGTMVVIFAVALIGWPIAYAWTVLARRGIGDPNAIEFALGAACVGAAAGFVWLSADWPRPEPGDWGLFEQFVRFGNVWLPLLMVGIAALLLLIWWTYPGEPQDSEPQDGEPQDSEPQDTVDRPNESGHAATGP
ncbi:hypothetical protein [Streptomyces sp. PT12]|uniref:hypothetical protein n=1 Tax=Streptomyces sp. PT12 TaxID=1510197 RepID=UPI001C686BAE|nr:hypothetical protein [Streptomyces sp. PT12]